MRERSCIEKRCKRTMCVRFDAAMNIFCDVEKSTLLTLRRQMGFVHMDAVRPALRLRAAETCLIVERAKGQKSCAQ